MFQLIGTPHTPSHLAKATPIQLLLFWCATNSLMSNKRTKCPLCAGEKQVLRMRGAHGEIIAYVRRVEIRRDAPGNLPCPFCQAKGQVAAEVDAAFRLMFPDNPQAITAHELKALQCQIS